MIHQIDLSGLHCAKCAARVTQALLALPGVTEARVTLMPERAVVRGEVPLDTALVTIRELGYGAEAHGTAVSLRQRIEARRAARRACAAYWRRQCFWALLALPVIFIAMAPMLGFPQPHRPRLEWLLATVALIALAPPFYRAGLRDLARFRFEMDALVTLGTLLAYGASVVELARGREHLYFEDAVAILAALSVGRWLEARAQARAAAAVERLIDLEAPRARLFKDGHETEVPVETLLPGDEVMIRPGDKAPVDGVVVEGRAEADEALMTGESLPVTKQPGDRVLAGSLIAGGALRVRAERTGEETALAEIFRETERIGETRTRHQELADRVVAVFMPGVLVIAALTFGGWLWRTGSWLEALRPAVAVMIIACPCALGLATPVAVAVGAGVAARRGILLRDAAALDRLPLIRAVVFDKTGTLTTGRLSLAASQCQGLDAAELLRLVAAVENNSEHPIGRALAAALPAGASLPPVENFQAVPGEGVSGRAEGWLIRIGTPGWTGLQIGREEKNWMEGETGQGRIVLTARLSRSEGAASALFSFSDPARPEAREVLAELHRRGLRTVIVSGDRAATVAALAKELGCDDIRAEVKPADKAAAIRELRERHGAVAMIGDGVNDAPALAEADLGVALATGAGLAVEAGSVTLTRADLRLLPELLWIGGAIRRKAQENLFWALFYNALLIPAAALGYASPFVAAIAMALSDVSVLANALRLWRVEKGDILLFRKK